LLRPGTPNSSYWEFCGVRAWPQKQPRGGAQHGGESGGNVAPSHSPPPARKQEKASAPSQVHPKGRIWIQICIEPNVVQRNHRLEVKKVQ